MLIQILSLVLSEMLGKEGRRRKNALVFPTKGAVECLGSGDWWKELGGLRGGRLFKGWLFALLVSRGLRSSVQQNRHSN